MDQRTRNSLLSSVDAQILSEKINEIFKRRQERVTPIRGDRRFKSVDDALEVSRKDRNIYSRYSSCTFTQTNDQKPGRSISLDMTKSKYQKRWSLINSGSTMESVVHGNSFDSKVEVGNNTRNEPARQRRRFRALLVRCTDFSYRNTIRLVRPSLQEKTEEKPKDGLNEVLDAKKTLQTEQENRKILISDQSSSEKEILKRYISASFGRRFLKLEERLRQLEFDCMWAKERRRHRSCSGGSDRLWDGKPCSKNKIRKRPTRSECRSRKASLDCCKSEYRARKARNTGSKKRETTREKCQQRERTLDRYVQRERTPSGYKARKASFEGEHIKREITHKQLKAAGEAWYLKEKVKDTRSEEEGKARIKEEYGVEGIDYNIVNGVIVPKLDLSFLDTPPPKVRQPAPKPLKDIKKRKSILQRFRDFWNSFYTCCCCCRINADQ